MAFDLQAETGKIRTQFNEGQWPQFLRSVRLTGLRGWKGERVEFKFPVTAIVGTNGSGKTTVLKAAACAYENDAGRSSYFPSDYFQSTHWDELSNIEIEYILQLGENSATKKITKLSERWSLPKKKAKRDVWYFDVGRTLPIDGTIGYAKVAKLAASELSATELDSESLKWYQYIMGREYQSARLSQSNVSENRRVGVVKYSDSTQVSQFHQGAGEDSAFDVIQSLSSIKKHSLILVDEVEASLHPAAQRRLVEFLLWLTRQYRAQVIVSTHSPFILEQLPPEARILLMRSTKSIEVIYGASSDFSLSKMDDVVHPDLHVFLEDDEARTWLIEILRSSDEGRELISRLAIFPVGPDNVVRTMGTLALKQKLPARGIAVLDGDKPSMLGALQLPGTEAPERVVFADLKAADWPGVPEALRTGAGSLFGVLDDVMTNPDHHKWPRIIGDKIRMSGRSVWENMCAAWVTNCCKPSVRSALTKGLTDALSS